MSRAAYPGLRCLPLLPALPLSPLKCLTCVKLNLCSSPKVYSTSNLIHNANLLRSTILFVREGFPGKYNQFPEDSETCSTIHTTTIHVFDQLQAWSQLIHNSRRKSWTFKTITQNTINLQLELTQQRHHQNTLQDLHNQFPAWTNTHQQTLIFSHNKP